MKYRRAQLPRNQGTAIIFALVMVFACTIALTGWTYLTAARMRESETVGIACQRHIAWQNTRALNSQNTLVNAFGSSANQGGVTTLLPQTAGYNGLTDWGGLITNSYSGINVFASTVMASGNIYPFENIRPTPTSDGGMFFSTIEDTFAGSDSTQTEHYFIYNYQKTYPGPLMGDLFIIHVKPSGASGSYTIGDNFLINGNVVIYDGTAVTNGMCATMCHNYLGTSNTTLNSTGSALLMPDNYPAVPTGHTGNGGAGGALLTDGTLKMINNTGFTPSSLYALMTASSSGYTTCSTTTATTLATGVVVTNPSTMPYTVPATSPYNYTPSSPKKVLTINLLTVTGHLYITGAYDQIILNGSTTAANYTTLGTLNPLIIMVTNDSSRDIRFVGENNRPLVLSTGTGSAGATVFMSFSGTSSVSGGPLRWRLQHINEYRNPWYDVPTGTGISLAITGGIRTNWSVNCTDTTNNIRISLSLDTNPSGLETLMPRDGWNEAYFYIR